MVRKRLTILAVLVTALVAAGCTSSPPPQPAPTAPSVSPAGNGYSLTINKIGVANAGLAPVGLNPDRTLEVPAVEQPEQAAVYERGPMPGEQGPAVVLGHVNGAGRPGVFARLTELSEGDTVETRGPDGGVTRFVVYRTVTVDKAEFPTAEVYSDTESPELRLITCGGDLDRAAGSYVGQVIVWLRVA